MGDGRGSMGMVGQGSMVLWSIGEGHGWARVNGSWVNGRGAHRATVCVVARHHPPGRARASEIIDPRSVTIDPRPATIDPARPVTIDPRQVTIAQPARYTRAVPRILVVDDSATVVNFLRLILESQKYEVDAAFDGTEGLVKAHEALPDLVITDSIMPGMDGFALVHALRADPATEAIPIIMLTSGDPHDPDHIVREPRPDAFVKKSADLNPLLAEVRSILESRR